MHGAKKTQVQTDKQLPRFLREFARYKRYPALCVMLLPVIVYFVIFKYVPMAGIVMAFKDYKIGLGIWGSPWVGLANFKKLFSTLTFTRAVRNTLIITVAKLVIGFPAPILFALLLNEVRTTGISARSRRSAIFRTSSPGSLWPAFSQNCSPRTTVSSTTS